MIRVVIMSDAQSRQVFKAIRRIVRAIDVRSKEVARATGLTIPQIVVLRGVQDLGEVTTTALSKYADLSSATVVTILDKLEKKGFVTRHRSEIDRRVVHTRLTDAGRETLDTVPDLLHEEFKQNFAACAPEERAHLVSAIETIAEMMDAQDLDASALLVTGSLQS